MGYQKKIWGARAGATRVTAAACGAARNGGPKGPIMYSWGPKGPSRPTAGARSWGPL